MEWVASLGPCLFLGKGQGTPPQEDDRQLSRPVHHWRLLGLQSWTVVHCKTTWGRGIPAKRQDMEELEGDTAEGQEVGLSTAQGRGLGGARATAGLPAEGEAGPQAVGCIPPKAALQSPTLCPWTED